MKLLTLLLPLLTTMVLVPTVFSKPLMADPTTGPALVGKPRSIGQASHFSPKPVQLDTNAKRFARGLPPLAPSRSRRDEGSPVRRTGASPLPPVTCTSCSGVIKVYNRDNGDPIGYISSIGNGYEYSQLYVVQAALDSNALRVHFTVPSGATRTVTDLNMLALNSKLPNADVANYLGLATWYEYPVEPGFGIAYMAGTVQKPAGNTPTGGANSWNSDATLESAVWTVDVSTWSMTLKWINPDGTLSTGLPFSEDDSILFGDREWKASKDGPRGRVPVRKDLSFIFVPDENLLQ